MKHLTLLSLITFGAASLGSAAIITPTPGSVVDPSGSEEVDHLASNSATLAAFNAQAGLGVVQNWVGITTDTVNIIDLSTVDVRITSTFSPYDISQPKNQDKANNLRTSGPAGDVEVDTWQNFSWSGTNGQTLTIEFGTWDGTDFTADRAVKSAGLTFINFGGAYNTASDQTITYLDSGDSVLSTQVFVGGLTDAQGSGGTEYFSGLISASQNISKLTIAITRDSGSSDIAIDDLAIVVPEPSTYAIFVGLMALGLVMVRRRLKN
jgi:hypothetical protein